MGGESLHGDGVESVASGSHSQSKKGARSQHELVNTEYVTILKKEQGHRSLPHLELSLGE